MKRKIKIKINLQSINLKADVGAMPVFNRVVVATVTPINSEGRFPWSNFILVEITVLFSYI